MATAVSLRKGTRDEHTRFRGDLGEVTFSTDERTLYVHSGDQTVGVPLARADLENVSTETIANKNIAKSDLSNVTITDPEKVKLNLAPLTYAQNNMSNVTTLDLMAGGGHRGPDVARADAININTTELAEGTTSSRNPDELGKNLAYADMSNVTTEDVVNKLTVGDEHLYADKDLNNVNTVDLATGAGTTGKHAGLNLAYANLSNLETMPETTKSNLYSQGIQITNNLTQTIDSNSTSNQYPSAKIVYDTIEAIPKVPNFNQLGTDSYQVLITSFLYNYQAEMIAAGDGYQTNDLLTLIDNDNHSLGINVNVLTVETNPDEEEGRIGNFELINSYGNTQINGTFNCLVNLIEFGMNAENLPAASELVEGKVYTATNSFTTSADFEIGAGTTEPALTVVKCINTGTDLSPIYKWRIVTSSTTPAKPDGARFTINSTATGAQEGSSQISWINLKSPITIRDTIMNDTTGEISVVFSRQPTHVNIKKLINGDQILGTWSNYGITMTFLPDVPADVLLDSWVIKVDG